jgi:hypothetical protein
MVRWHYWPLLTGKTWRIRPAIAFMSNGGTLLPIRAHFSLLTALNLKLLRKRGQRLDFSNGEPTEVPGMN